MFKTKPKSNGVGRNSFVKFEDGTNVKGVVRGEPYEFRQHWKDSKSVLCSGDICPLCAEGDKSLWRFRINFIVNENGVYVAKILEQGKRFADSLEEIGKEMDLYTNVLKISRKGAKTNTTYTIIPTGPVTPEQKKTIDAVKLLDLAHDAEPKETDSEDDEEQHEDIPF